MEGPEEFEDMLSPEDYTAQIKMEEAEDDDDIFFYLDSERELEEFKKEGVHDWVILDVVKDNCI